MTKSVDPFSAVFSRIKISLISEISHSPYERTRLNIQLRDAFRLKFDRDFFSRHYRVVRANLSTPRAALLRHIAQMFILSSEA